MMDRETGIRPTLAALRPVRTICISTRLADSGRWRNRGIKWSVTGTPGTPGREPSAPVPVNHQAGGQPVGQAQAGFDLAQCQHAAIRGKLAAVEPGNNGLAVDR